MKYTHTMQKIDVETVLQLNQINTKELINKYEEEYHEKIVDVSREFIKSGCRVLLLSGPSSSGKTTTAKKIRKELISQGKEVYIISLDDFFKQVDKMPLWSDGQRNYESVDCLDLDYFEKIMLQIQNEKKANFPIFDFNDKKRSDKTFEITINENTCLIFEGIHALNPKVTEHILGMDFYRVYVSVHSDFVLNDEIIMQARQLRLMRRTLRDRLHRKTNAIQTFHLWKYVLKGEEEYIHPFREQAEYHLNSAHGYEPLLYRRRMFEILHEGESDENYGELCKELIKTLYCFGEIDENCIPDNSVIQEFNR